MYLTSSFKCPKRDGISDTGVRLALQRALSSLRRSASMESFGQSTNVEKPTEYQHGQQHCSFTKLIIYMSTSLGFGATSDDPVFHPLLAANAATKATAYTRRFPTKTYQVHVSSVQTSRTFLEITEIIFKTSKRINRKKIRWPFFHPQLTVTPGWKTTISKGFSIQKSIR